MYIPHPIPTESVELSAELLQLTEQLAVNVHEVWAAERMAEGWQYGHKHDYDRKQHPCLVPYDKLPESEKNYDRKTAMETLKVIKLFGFELIR